MTTLDLVAQAERRAAIANTLGTLLLTEPGPHLSDLVDGIAEFEPLTSQDISASGAVDYERVLLREVPPYASVFLGHDGRRGGEVADEVTSSYLEVGFAEHRDATWRVAGPDHLGLILRCYAQLCSEEVDGWVSDRPDQAVRTVEASRRFLDQHLAWGVIAAEAISRAGGAETPYGVLGVSISQFLHEQGQLLRPAPDHPGIPDDDNEPALDRFGAHRLTQLLLSPRRVGGWLSTGDIAALAGAVGVPWRASDPRRNLRFVLDSAIESGETGVLADELISVVDGWRAAHQSREQRYDGAARIWRRWRETCESTLGILERVRAGDLAAGDRDRPLVTTFEINGRLDEVAERVIQEAIDSLRAGGLSVRWSGW